MTTHPHTAAPGGQTMSDDQAEQIWNALHTGKIEATRALGMSRHLEGSAERFSQVEAEINTAMDLVQSLREAQSDV